MPARIAHIAMTTTELSTLQEALFAVQRMPDYHRKFTQLQRDEIQWVLNRIGSAFVELGNKVSSTNN